MDLDKAIESALRATDEDDFDPRSLGLAFERAGNAAFDGVLRKLEEPGTSDQGRIRGLRMLALLTRHFCVPRKPELIELSLRLMKHSNAQVRSAALNTALFGVSTMGRLGAFPDDVVRAILDRVRREVALTIERGLMPEQEELARRFMTSDGTVRVVPEE